MIYGILLIVFGAYFATTGLVFALDSSWRDAPFLRRHRITAYLLTSSPLAFRKRTPSRISLGLDRFGMIFRFLAGLVLVIVGVVALLR
jgi:hypothetical protein